MWGTNTVEALDPLLSLVPEGGYSYMAVPKASTYCKPHPAADYPRSGHGTRSCVPGPNNDYLVPPAVHQEDSNRVRWLTPHSQFSQETESIEAEALPVTVSYP
jgi:hypothetical protein